MDSQITYIRNILRKEGITGMKSIDHCIVFIVSRMLTKEMCKRFNIENKFSFDNILIDSKGKELGDQDFYGKIYNKNKPNECLVGILFNNLGYKNIKFQVKGIHNLKLIYQKLAEIDINKLDKEYDIIGTIYEIHLKSGTSNSMRDLGQYYTHRKVIKYMIELCKPTIKNGIIEKILDPTMGTGGFLTMAVKYLNNNSTENINWKNNKDNILGFDIDDNVTNMARLNVLLETGELCTDTIVKQDTLHQDLKLPSGEILQKADVILANEPMGIKGLKHAECCERIKELKIRGTKAEPLFLQLFMEALNKDGRCAVIVPDGVLFTESFLHKETRKHLIENFNLKKVISLQDKDFFMNTGVKTSILYFENNGKTKEVEFCEIKLVDGNIKEESILKAKYKELVEKDYSLFVNKYKVEEKENYGEVKLIKLGDICKMKTGIKCSLVHAYTKKNGNNLIRINNLLDDNAFIKINEEYTNKYKDCITKKNNILIATVTTGKLQHKIVPDEWNGYNFNGAIINMYDIQQNPKYLYYAMKYIEKDILNKASGSIQQNLSKQKLFDIQIPVPSLTLQQKIVEKLDILSNNIKNSMKMIKEQKEIMKMYIEMETIDGEEVKLKDIIDINYGTRIKRNEVEKKNGLFGCYGGGNLVFYMDKFNREGKTIIISRFGVSENCVRIVNNKFWLNDSGMSITSNNKKILINNFLGYSTINLLKEQIYNISVGACQKNVNIDDFKNLKLLLPSLAKQQEIVSYCDNIQNTIDKLKKHVKDNHKLMKDIMEAYLKKSTTKNEINDDKVDEEALTKDKEDPNTYQKAYFCAKFPKTFPKIEVIKKYKLDKILFLEYMKTTVSYIKDKDPKMEIKKIKSIVEKYKGKSAKELKKIGTKYISLEKVKSK